MSDDFSGRDGLLDTDASAGPATEGIGLRLIASLIGACLVLWLTFALATTAGSPLAFWRGWSFAMADPNAPALLAVAFGSSGLLLACGVGLGVRWRHWLLQALQPWRLSLASLGRWLAVVGLVGAGVAGLYALMQDRSRLDGEPMSWFVDVIVGFFLILPLLMWMASRTISAFSGWSKDVDWDLLDHLPRSIAWQLARKQLVPQRVSCGALIPPQWTPPPQGTGGTGDWVGSGWLMGDDCFVTFTFSKPGTAGQDGPKSPRRGWRVQGHRDDFAEPATTGTRTVPLDEAWGRAQKNAHPESLPNPIDAVPVAAWAKVTAHPGTAGITYGIAFVATPTRIGYRFSAFADNDSHVVAVSAERTLKVGRSDMSNIDAVLKRLLAVPWTVTFARGRLDEASNA